MNLLIVVPVYNAEPWIGRCMESIVRQNERDFLCAVFDDASTDRTGRILDEMALDSRFEVVHNPLNVGALANLVEGFERLGSREDPESICVTIDGDDSLANADVFRRVREVYRAVPSCLLTYGNCVPLSTMDACGPFTGSCRAIPLDVVRARSFRKHPFLASHLRTFKSKLWNNIWEKDLRDPETGEYCRAGWDVLMMIPMLEMAGDRFRFIEEVLYVVNDTNPINDCKVHLEAQGHHARRVKKLPKYPLLKGDRIPRWRFALKRMLLRNPGVRRILEARHRMLQRLRGAGDGC